MPTRLGRFLLKQIYNLTVAPFVTTIWNRVLFQSRESELLVQKLPGISTLFFELMIAFFHLIVFFSRLETFFMVVKKFAPHWKVFGGGHEKFWTTPTKSMDISLDSKRFSIDRGVSASQTVADGRFF